MNEWLSIAMSVILSPPGVLAVTFGLIFIFAWLISEGRRQQQEDDEFERCRRLGYMPGMQHLSQAAFEQELRSLEARPPKGYLRIMPGISGSVSAYDADGFLVNAKPAPGIVILPPDTPAGIPHVLTYMGRMFRAVDDEQQPWTCAWCGTRHAEKLAACDKCGHAYDPAPDPQPRTTWPGSTASGWMEQ